jgi:hypothetical protein
MVHHAIVNNKEFVDGGGARNHELFCPPPFDVIIKDANQRGLQYHEWLFATLPVSTKRPSQLAIHQTAPQAGLAIQPFFYCTHCRSMTSIDVGVAPPTPPAATTTPAKG